MFQIKNHFLVCIAVILSGCGQGFQSESQSTLKSVNSGEKLNTSVPACTVAYNEYEIQTEFLSFELQDQFNVSFGFNIINKFLSALGFKLKIQKGEMRLSMTASPATEPQRPAAIVTGSGSMNKTEFNFELEATNLLNFGTGYFRQTPMWKLLKSTLESGLGGLNAELASEWKSRVVALPSGGKLVVIPSGAAAGVRIGDEFNIYNINYIWKGKACESELLLEAKTSSQPINWGRVIQVEDNASLIEVDGSTESIMLGARVEIKALPLIAAERSRQLARAIKILPVKGTSLPLPQGQKFDYQELATEELKSSLKTHHFHLSF